MNNVFALAVLVFIMAVELAFFFDAYYCELDKEMVRG